MEERPYENPVVLQDWINERLEETKDDERPNDLGVDQAIFIRDCIHPLLENNYDNRKLNPLMAVSHHQSKSVVLPVVRFASVTRGLEVWMRCNFYDWKFSVQSQRAIPDVFHRLFTKSFEVAAVHCEGFKPEWVFGPYELDQSKFTIEIPGSLYKRDFTMGTAFTFCFLLGEVTR